MAKTREPRRRRDKALQQYLSLLARQLRDARFPTAQTELAKELMLSPPQFTQALKGQTSSLEVANAFARREGVSLDELRTRARAWHDGQRVELAARKAVDEISVDEVDDLINRIKELADDSKGALRTLLVDDSRAAR